VSFGSNYIVEIIFVEKRVVRRLIRENSHLQLLIIHIVTVYAVNNKFERLIKMVESITKQMREATREIHSISDALVNTKLLIGKGILFVINFIVHLALEMFCNNFFL
jgi:hypothetical protein